MTWNRFFAVAIYLVNFIGGLWIYTNASVDNKFIIFCIIFVFAHAQSIYLNYKIIKLEEKLDETS